MTDFQRLADALEQASISYSVCAHFHPLSELPEFVARKDAARAAILSSHAALAARCAAYKRLFELIAKDEGESDEYPWHSHDRPGIWDDSNKPEIAGKPCELCAAWKIARAALAGGST